jgi:hypothetical protein
MPELADLTSYYIEGIAAMGNVPFRVSLITHVEGTLWQGGTPATTPNGLGPLFQYVLNLYPWIPYSWDMPKGVECEMRTAELYDRGEVPDPKLLEDLAQWVNEKRQLGTTLVHCQAGLNRSALVVALALIRTGRTPHEAIKLLREKRSPAVLCNASFERWLRRQDRRQKVDPHVPQWEERRGRS